MRRAFAGAALLAGAIYLFRLDRVAGLVVDDAWYALLGMALARGDGYQLISAPNPGLLPPNPPAYAALLAIGFSINPRFPDNVLLLKTFSIAAMLATGALTYIYARSRRGWSDFLALAVATLVVIAPSFVFLATSTLMSECVFTFAQLLAVILIDRARGRIGTAAAGAAAAATVLIRTAGVGLPIGAAIHVCSAKQWRRAVMFAAMTSIVVTPWLIYSRVHAPTMAQRLAHGGAHAFTYGQEFWMRWAGNPASGTVGVRELPKRVWTNAVDVFGRDVGGIVVPALFRGPSESGEEVIGLGGTSLILASMGSAWQTMIISLLLSAVATIGFVGSFRRARSAAEPVVLASLGIVLLWPQWAFRFVLPLAPFLFVYLVDGVRVLVGPVHFPRVARIAALSVLGLNVLDHAGYIAAARDGRADWLIDARDVDELTSWMQTHAAEEDGIVASTNPALVYLRTGHKAIAVDGYEEKWRDFKARGVRYIVSFQQGAEPPSEPQYTLRYKSPRRGYWIVEM